ncbi:MAG TPA: S41 family peptidase [Spirochaetia bacterium]|nr:S41 family peptidase [Spirochaetia bacterium]
MMSHPRVRLLIIAGLALTVVVSFLGGATAERALRLSRRAPDPVVQHMGPDFALIRHAWDIINQEYVDRSVLTRGTLTSGAIGGMVDSLGDTGHSTYLTAKMVDEERSLMSGEYVGVGLEISQKSDNVVIVAPLDGSPAIRAGLRAGEQILKVNGQSVEGMELNQVVSLIVGPAETTVVLSIFDPASGTTQQVPLRRERIHLDNVTWKQLPGYPFADIRIAAFSRGVAKEVRSALLQIEHMKLTGVILDLRNNPGGELHEAIGVASQFMASGDVVLEKDVRGRVTHDNVEAGGVATTLPVVTLINQGTASGAEIVAGALQDAKRARLVGETTFGTGTVLENFPLPDGSALLLAVREWLTPDGRAIWHKGIVPDDHVSLPANATLISPGDASGMTKNALDGSSDSQMKKAVELLQRR